MYIKEYYLFSSFTSYLATQTRRVTIIAISQSDSNVGILFAIEIKPRSAESLTTSDGLCNADSNTDSSSLLATAQPGLELAEAATSNSVETDCDCILPDVVPVF